jgi:hypothetical protein
MKTNDLVGTFVLFILGLFFIFNSWRSLTRNQITYRFTQYRREDSPFAFWFYVTMNILCAVLFSLMGIVFSIYLLRSSSGS